MMTRREQPTLLSWYANRLSKPTTNQHNTFESPFSRLYGVCDLLLRQTSWRLIAEFLVVFAADFITHKLYGKRIMVKRNGIWRNESLGQISTSNLLALVISIGLSSVYLAFNESAAGEVSRNLDGMSFSSGNILTGLSSI